MFPRRTIQDFEPSPPTCNGLETYLELPTAADMRYNQDNSIGSLTIEAPPQQQSVLSAFPAPLLNSHANTGYSPDTNSFYSPASHISFSGIDPRSRLGSNSTSSTGMAHAHRSAALPNPGYSARDLYAGVRPSFPRTTEHTTRSPSFAAPLRRHPLSPTPSPSIGFTSPVRMDTGHSSYGKGAQVPNIPPLMPMTTHGTLVYADAGAPGSGTPIKIDIQGTIDKGFFLSEGEWTCYRRNYFSCICSYSLTPHYPNASMQYVPTGSSTPYQVFGFAMCISAVVSDSDSHSIELVQHTPKRDKGPTARPERVRLTPKPPTQSAHPLGVAGMYSDHHGMSGGSRSMYEPGAYGQSSQNSFATEHTFERIQFKQATANNGKRRAAQQYYHLMVELFVDVGTQNPGDQFMKIAQRKSAKMIVRGRSPGHYQTERRGSTSSGPGGSSGMGSYGSNQVIGADYSSGSSSMLPSAYGTGGYDPRSGHYGTTRHNDMPLEPIISAEEAKAVDTAKEYQYYPSTIYEGADTRHGIEMFSHRGEHEHMLSPSTTTVDTTISKVKHEYDGTLPSLFYNPGTAYSPRSCGRFEGKYTSAGYYPTPLSQSG
ncbi:Uu.00g053720.m01.CDS01 [Anthostomella pinea]|uniref:Uu.00g053720.m01.CDS01 n=1 Tax=Anthostomella pinea TaxID=933095 RepID=A0AAI8VWI1_9PEZI|nr:Uu.00g053720.m01.CDS01 [Anthostomella pinea]